MESAQGKVSGRKLLSALMVIVLAIFGAVAALFAGVTSAKYLVYLLVPIGATLTILGAIGASTGKIEKDF